MLKGEVLRWAVDEAARCGASAIVCAGDMVGSGRRAEARAVAAALADSPIPVSFTPGNAELRTPAESADVRAILSDAPPPEGVALLDSSAGLNDETLRDALSTGLLAKDDAHQSQMLVDTITILHFYLVGIGCGNG